MRFPLGVSLVNDPLRTITVFFLIAYFTVVGSAVLWLILHRRYRARTFNSAYRPGVTILKPIAGVDECLESNLVSFFELNYEPLQIVFGCDRDDDPGIRIVRQVAARYPERDVLILTRIEGTAASPKLVNLEAMLPHAKHPLILLSDSNVRIRRDELASLVQPMQDERVGMVYQPVVGVDEITAPAAIENLRLAEYPGIASIFCKAVHAEDCVMGKGMLCRRSALASINDFAPVRDTAADDFLLGRALYRAGWKLYMSEIPAWTVHTHWSWKSFYRRQYRHAAMRVRMAWPGFVLEAFGSPPMIWALLAWFGGWSAVPYILFCMAVKTVCESLTIGWIRSQRVALRHWWLVTFKDISMVWVLSRSLFYSRVHWRGKEYRMVKGTKLIRIYPPGESPATESMPPHEQEPAAISK